ncbi:MAG TPA: outer membrane protein assembly factor BamA [Terracidiphilus sp.]|nr:outer membrane protein assembly factor BamA [Terracidiphilus sp.]
MHILPVKPNYGPHQYLCSPQDIDPVKIKHVSTPRAWRRLASLARVALVLLLVVTAGMAVAQTPQTIDQIRVIGNRRIPKETILARLFTHPGDTYDPVSIERDFNSLWNTGYFEDLRIEREDSAKGIILNIFVREKPTIREINYKGLNSVSVSDVLDRFKKEKVPLSQEGQYDPTSIKRAETVIRQILAEHGHQFATIKTDVKTIPPAYVQVNFNIKEGPVVKVGRIRFTGNQHLTSRYLRRSMKDLRPIGIPYSLIFENLFPRTFDSSKLQDDTERVRFAYRDKGYYNAAVEEPKTQIRDQGGLNWFTFQPNKGKRIDILLPIEEGDRYRLGTITFTGNKAVTNVRALRATFAIKDGDWFNATMIGKGLENLKKAYGALGYINFGAIPKPIFNEKNKTVSLEVDIDEGKPFYVSRIEFQGNTITRDRVIRRELLLQEGQVYNSQLWEYSLLRLNQLQYFEPLKVDQDSEAHQNPEAGTVELLLKVKEKGKNSIGLNGGVSGLNGAFLGVNYQTNNFLGLGETLSVQANLGNVSRQFLFGFTQPYIRNRPIQVGFQIFNQKQDYNAAKNYQSTTGQSVNLTSAEKSLTQNYNQATTGLNFSVSYPLKRHAFQRVGFTYSLTRSTISAFSTASATFFQTISFRSGIQGSNALAGIINSMASFSYIYNTVNDQLRPRGGKEITAVFQFAGIGGNLRYFSPLVAYKSYHSMHYLRFSPNGHNVLALRAQLGYVQGFGGDVAPPNNRFYTGGDQDLRGFDVRGATPYGYVPNRVMIQLTNPDGTCVPRDPTNPQLGQCIQVPIPVYGVASIGGDTNLTTNAEYRIPIGPVTFSLFDDFGIDAALNKGQLKQSPQGFATLTAPLYGCPVYNNGACQGGIPGSEVGFQRDIRPISGANFVPRMSLGGEISIVMPVVNAPFRLYYAYNPLRLYERPYCNDVNLGTKVQSCSAQLITRDMFPPGGAGDYTYQEAIEGYGARNLFREPRKTFRLTVSTTF